MFPLGHIGISVGIVYLMAVYLLSPKNEDNLNSPFAWDIDFRIVIIAAMLPDIIDKLVGMLFFKEEFSNGRIFTHSILIVGLFSILLFIFGKAKLQSHLKTFGYALAIWLHLVLDSMWKEPNTLFWPFLGTDFPRVDVEFSDYFTILFTEPAAFLGEIIGGLIIVALIFRHKLYTKSNILDFFRNGKLNNEEVKK
jgi:membrane-bound metal-dependent hydrolase YbcI (DUF457 family)